MGTTSYSYDAARRLTSVFPAGGSQISFAYDGNGARKSKTTSAGATTYVNDARGLATVLQETKAGNTISYVPGLTQFDPSQVGNAQWAYFHADHTNNRGLTDGGAFITKRWEYDPFGVVRSETGTANSDFGYAGEQKDPETGLINLRARYYDPALGRFMSRDVYTGRPGFPQSFNRYAYALNNPMRGLDPSGYTTYCPEDMYECYEVADPGSEPSRGSYYDDDDDDYGYGYSSGYGDDDYGYGGYDYSSSYASTGSEADSSWEQSYSYHYGNASESLFDFGDFDLGDGDRDFGLIDDALSYGDPVGSVELWIGLALAPAAAAALVLAAPYVEAAGLWAMAHGAEALGWAEFGGAVVGTAEAISSGIQFDPYNRSEHYGGSQTDSPYAQGLREAGEGTPCPGCGAIQVSGTSAAPSPQHDPALVVHYYEHGGAQMTSAERRAYAQSPEAFDGTRCAHCQQVEGAAMSRYSRAQRAR